MANTLRLKRSAVSGRVPATTDLSLGEVAINTNDGRVFLKKDDGTEAIVEVIADDGAGNVGIGTTSPDTSLEVVSSGATGISSKSASTQATDTNKALKVRNNSTTDTFNVSYKGQGYFAGKVGIGTSSHTAHLHVRQSAVTSAPSRTAALYLENNANCEIQFVGNSSNDCQLRFGTTSNSFKGALEYELDNDNLKAYTNGSERLRIDSSGNVGIGTTSPTNQLHILDNTAANNRAELKIQSFRPIIRFQDRSTSSASSEIVGDSGLRFNVSTPVDDDTQLTERMRINSNGSVGIGTSSPRTRLDVTNSSPSDTGGILVQNVNYANNQDKPYFVIGTSGWTGATTNWNTYGFQHKIKTDSAGVPRVTIDSANGEAFCVRNDRRVGIGTTSPGKELDVQGSIRSVGTSATIGLPVGTTAERPGSPAQGELRFNSTDTAAEIYDGSAWAAVGSGGGATGGGSDQWAVEHDNTITASYTISSGKNVISAGPLTVNSGAVVTVPSGSNWVIV